MTRDEMAIANSWLTLTVPQVLGTLLIVMVIVLGAVRLVMSDVFLHIEYTRPDFPLDSYGLTTADRLHYAPYALTYLLTSADIDYLAKLTLPDGSVMFNSRELSHMIDVKQVMHGAMLTLMMSVTALVLVSLAAWLTHHQAWWLAVARSSLWTGGWLIISILAALIVYLLAAWDSFFTTFHSLFFAQGSWQFYYSDSLIRLFPIRFWQDAALTVGGLSLLGAVAALGLSRWLGTSKYHREPSP